MTTGQGAGLLGQRYQLLREIDRGGMGVVWEAEDSRLGRRVAVKLLHAQFAADPEFLERFRREARAAAALSHPNIVAVYDVGEAGGTEAPFIVMELVKGESLKGRIRRLGRLSDGQVRTIGAVVAVALDYAHRQGVIHRDVKPENILMDDNGGAKLTDFGIAEALAASGLTRTGAVMGSVHYLAPELARGQPATPRSDVYSLGVVLYEMATGRVPFTGDTELSVALAHVEQTAPRPRAVNPAVAPSLEAIIMRAMAREPEQRFQSAGDLARALEQPDADSVTTRMPAAASGSGAAAARATTVAMPRVAQARAAAAPARLVKQPPRHQGGRGSGWGLVPLLLALALVLAVVGAGLFGFATFAREGSPPATATPTARPATPTAPSAPAALAPSATATAASSPSPTEAPSPSPSPTIESSPTPLPPTATATTAPTAVPTPRVVIVPALVGLSTDAAMAALRSAGLTARVQAANVNAEPGTVVSQAVAPGTAVVPGSPASVIVFAVATGQVAVPDVVGRSRAEATSLLFQAGFKVPVVREQKNNRAPPGTALATNPAAGRVIPRGSDVELTVSPDR